MAIYRRWFQEGRLTAHGIRDGVCDALWWATPETCAGPDMGQPSTRTTTSWGEIAECRCIRCGDSGQDSSQIRRTLSLEVNIMRHPYNIMSPSREADNRCVILMLYLISLVNSVHCFLWRHHRALYVQRSWGSHAVSHIQTPMQRDTNPLVSTWLLSCSSDESLSLIVVSSVCVCLGVCERVGGCVCVCLCVRWSLCSKGYDVVFVCAKGISIH